MSTGAERIAGYSVASLPRALGGVVGSGSLRNVPEDFQVDEILGFALAGEGEHVYLYIEKRDTNTEWLARQLARFARVPPRDLGYAGLKDRHALTRQWFSVRPGPGPEPDWGAFENDGIHILRTVRHRRKLRRGALRGNRFRLCVRDLQADPSALETRLQALAEAGVPNYFGEQRFGHDNSNLTCADQLFAGGPNPGRHRRSLALSAVRSWLFNEVLARRVHGGTWARPIPGDLLQPDGSHGVFLAESIDAEIERRAKALEIHPTGPLWGIERIRPLGPAGATEQAVAQAHRSWIDGLEHLRVEGDRRALRVPVEPLDWDLSRPGCLELSFALSAGAYATVVLRELLAVQTPGG